MKAEADEIYDAKFLKLRPGRVGKLPARSPESEPFSEPLFAPRE